MEFGVFAQLFVPQFERDQDPHAEHKRIFRNIEIAKAADRNAFKYVWCPQHHFLDEYSHMPGPEAFLGKAVKAFLIKPMGPLDVERPKAVTPDTSVAYGEYLANSVSNCAGCHTTRDLMTGAYIGEQIAGWAGMEGNTEGTCFTTPNLTTDPETGQTTEKWIFPGG